MMDTEKRENAEEKNGSSVREKVDLHIHLDGSLSWELAARFLEEDGKKIQREELKSRLTAPLKCEDLKEYLRCFGLPLQLLQSRRNLEAAAMDLVNRLGRQGLTYAEIRFAPQLHKERGLTSQDAAEAVISGMKKGLKQWKQLKAGVLFCMMVTGTDRDNEETLELSGAYLGKGAVGLDLAGAEGAVPMEHFRPFFEKARRRGIPFTIHAGENGDAENVRRAVRYGAARIGHGCAAVKDPECMELLRREGTVLEMCPVSNVQTNAVPRIEDHPIRKFMEYGIRVTVNTDNMTVSDTDLDREYALLKNCLHFTGEELLRLNEDARRAGFL